MAALHCSMDTIVERHHVEAHYYVASSAESTEATIARANKEA